MNIESYRGHCISKPGVTEEFPFDNVTLVFKVMGKMFALTNVDKFESINLKCDPDRSVELRASHPGITPGFHMNKKHWNTLIMDNSINDELILELINHSYDLVVKSLTRKLQEELNQLD